MGFLSRLTGQFLSRFALLFLREDYILHMDGNIILGQSLRIVDDDLNDAIEPEVVKEISEDKKIIVWGFCRLLMDLTQQERMYSGFQPV